MSDTHTEAICKLMGQQPPNQDMETGIHYGVINQNELSGFSLDDIYNGRDLGFEEASESFKKACENAASNVTKGSNCLEIYDAIYPYLSDYVYSGNIRKVSEALEDEMDGWDTVVESDIAYFLQDYLEDHFNDTYGMNCDSGPYLYESDGYRIQTDSYNDLFVLKSPYYTLCRECSPCAPNAGYLTSEGGGMKSYCLGHDWFEDGKAPYKVYSVKTDEEILPNEQSQ